MRLSLIRILFLSLIAPVAVLPLSAQTQQETDELDSLFLPAPADLSGELMGRQGQSLGASPAEPAPPESPATGFRRTIQELRKGSHLYVYCKLKAGKILTGQIKAAGFEAFDIKTDVLGGIHTVKYEDLAESPRAVPAVGTRFRQGAEWAGVGIGAVVLLPLFILLSPILFAAGVRC